MLVGGFEKRLEHIHGFFELARELLVLLVAPGVAQADELAVQGGDTLAQVAVELLEVMGEAPQLDGAAARRADAALAARRAPIALDLAAARSEFAAMTAAAISS